MSLSTSLLYAFEVAAALAAAGFLFVRNVFHGVLLLMVSLLSLAGIYVLTFAEFVAVTQILIYAGGILVLVVFGIMLTMRISGKPLVVEHVNVFSGALAGILLFGLLAYSVAQLIVGKPPENELTTTRMYDFGVALMTDFVLPFEVAGILLLTSLVGAAVIATRSTISQPKNR